MFCSFDQVNGTACAIPRMIMAIVENNQNEVSMIN